MKDTEITRLSLAIERMGLKESYEREIQYRLNVKTLLSLREWNKWVKFQMTALEALRISNAGNDDLFQELGEEDLRFLSRWSGAPVVWAALEWINDSDDWPVEFFVLWLSFEGMVPVMTNGNSNADGEHYELNLGTPEKGHRWPRVRSAMDDILALRDRAHRPHDFSDFEIPDEEVDV